MLSKTELKILKLLFDDLTKEYTIREISLNLASPYPQTHRSTRSLLKRELIKRKKQGKSWIINLILEKSKGEYIFTELERKKDIGREYSLIKILINDLKKLNYSQFICVLFGSYAGKNAKKDSDIDLLFIIPKEYDYGKFEKAIKTTITLNKVDFNLTTDEGLMEMWKNPLKLNVGNELLKKHVVLYGAEQFLELRRKYYVGW